MDRSLHGIGLTYAELSARTGDMAAFGGVREVELSNGVERGIRSLEFRTGTGLAFEVLVDRAMDIGPADHSGRQVGWRSPTGFRHPGLHEQSGDDGMSWLRSFSGLCVTAGLDHTLFKAEVDASNYAYPHRQTIRHGLHGRVGNLPAALQGYGETWTDDGCTLWAEGEVRQASVFGENLRLRRRVESSLGSNEIVVLDEVVNAGYDVTPHMYLYHINVGWPIVDAGTRFVASIGGTSWMSDSAANPVNAYHTMTDPIPGYVEQVYELDLSKGSDGRHRVALINDRLGFGLMVDWDAEAMPYFFEWVNLRSGSYAVGLEPSTHHVEGNQAARDDGSMIWLGPGESRSYSLRYTVLTNAEECQEAERSIRAAGGQPATDVP